ncbi:hypothetical protein MKI79_09750, partial [Acinetobacter sp. A3.8]
IEMFYNSKRRHGSNGQRSPLDYEKAIKRWLCVSRILVAIQPLDRLESLCCHHIFIILRSKLHVGGLDFSYLIYLYRMMRNLCQI